MPMSLHKALGLTLSIAGLTLAGRLLAADTPDLLPQARTQAQQPRPPLNVPSRPAAGSQEPQSFLDAQSEMERRRLLDMQERTFQLEVDAKYAKALKAYCDTGYGDERCFRPDANKPVTVVTPTPAPPAAAEATVVAAQKTHSVIEPRELPTVAQITGFGDELSAILVFSNGRRLRVFTPAANGPRSTLPDGETVVSIRPGEVLVSRPGEGKPVPLLFQSAQPNFTGSE